uniref:Hydroxysteroid dehydrogenase-like protein 2 n=1 Tax=Gouania willdenowi TaxID=441366 RepID=A0A8C5G4N5_GOUWI
MIWRACTLFITGASRGIGKAIALKAARDGANVVIAAKNHRTTPKLPGTIYTAAQEVEAAGGKALPCVVDIRDEQQIGEAVKKAVDTFGGIDILVNNASAISLTGTLETPMKRVDLMLGINLRGTYLTYAHARTHVRMHTRTLSPCPVSTAYTMAKYGMSMCVLGMAEEFRGQIAVNALWPKTAIQTAAMDMLGGEGVAKQCRTADIMADAAYTVLSQPNHYTGHFLVDEDVLRANGVEDFTQYAVQPGHPLLPDFFLDAEPETLAQQMEQHGATPAFKPASEAPPPSSAGPIENTFDLIKGVINDEVVKATKGIYQFNRQHSGVWFMDLKNGAGSVGRGEPNVKADVVMTMDSDDFTKMFAGKMKPTMAFMSGKLRIKGDMTLAIKLEKLMGRMNSKL